MSESKTNWWSEHAATLIVGVVSGLAVALFTVWLTSARPHLYYASGDVVPFPDESDEFGLFTVTVTNDGSAGTEEILCLIDLGQCDLLNVQAGPKILNPKVEFEKPKEPVKPPDNAVVMPVPYVDTTKNEARVTVPRMLPGDSVAVYVKSASPGKIAAARKVIVRSKDVVGEPRSAVQIGGLMSNFLPFVGLAGGFVVAAMMFGGMSLLLHRYEAWKLNVESKRTKLVRFLDGPMAGQVIEGSAAEEMYAELLKKRTILIRESAAYRVAIRNVDKSGKLELVMMRTYL